MKTTVIATVLAGLTVATSGCGGSEHGFDRNRTGFMIDSPSAISAYWMTVRRDYPDGSAEVVNPWEFGVEFDVNTFLPVVPGSYELDFEIAGGPTVDGRLGRITFDVTGDRITHVPISTLEIRTPDLTNNQPVKSGYAYLEGSEGRLQIELYTALTIPVPPDVYRFLDYSSQAEVANVTVPPSTRAELDLGALQVLNPSSQQYDLYAQDGQQLIDSDLAYQDVYFVAPGDYVLRVAGTTTIVSSDVHVTADHVSVIQ